MLIIVMMALLTLPAIIVCLLFGVSTDWIWYWFLFLFVTVIIGVKVDSMKDEKEMKELAAKRDEQRAEEERKMRSGEWNFPYEMFYEICSAQCLGEEFDEFTKQKVSIIVQKVAEKEGVPQDCVHLYLSDEKLKEYHASWHRATQEKDREKKEKEKLRYITPQDTIFTDEQKAHREYVDRVWDMSPVEKRQEIITRKMKSIYDKIQGFKAMEQLSGIVADSAYIQRKNDWATLGGAASAIAGPGAGAVVAAQAIADNQRIEQENAANCKFASDFAGELSVASSTGDYYQEQLRKYSKEHEDLAYKVVFREYDTNTLFEGMSFNGEVCLQKGIFYVKVTIINNFHPKEGIKVKTIVDGTAEVKVYCDDIFVDTVRIALPDNGLHCNGESGTCYYQPAKYMIDAKNRNFRFEFAPHRLWLMEE